MAAQRREPLSHGASSAELEAARVLLNKLGVSPAALIGDRDHKPDRIPTFAEYIPNVFDAISASPGRLLGTCLAVIEDAWGHRRLDEPTVTDPCKPRTERVHAPERRRSASRLRCDGVDLAPRTQR
ncbi:hypothetical protein [Amycolatopsis suaedae]|uniref:Uncharacterized protein n=1 Tax=Amycolatopsis suaedae TaxID=2510978 RepID=A0A4Q7J3H0_9PSEU|nr:hypothetical protein [Amycolatopsis suaedae]RZQ61507.1 hypothetical protein EWH70_24380 [Amycolatopsis suaedae]